MPAPPPRLRGSVGSLALVTGPSPGYVPLSLNCPWQIPPPSSLQYSHQPWAVYTRCYLHWACIYLVLSTPGPCIPGAVYTGAVYTRCCLHWGWLHPVLATAGLCTPSAVYTRCCVHPVLSTPGAVYTGRTASLPSSSLSADRKCLQGDILLHQETPGWPAGTGGQRPPQHSLQGSPLPRGKCCLSLPPSGFPVPAAPAAEGQQDKEC